MKKGFTLVEILLVMGIFAILATLTGINFFSTYNRSNLNAAKDVIIADIKTAQSNAMSGKGQNGLAVDGWGVKIISDTQYAIFPGITYSIGNSGNIITTVPRGVTLTSNFPSSSIVFNHGSGDVAGFTVGQDVITLTSDNAAHTFRFNLHGAIIGD